MKPSQLYDHDPKHWWFERDTKLPVGAFDENRHVDRIVLIFVLAMFVIGMLAAGWIN